MATIYKRNGRYYLNWSESGQQFRRSLGSISRGQAEEVRAIKEAELKTGVRLTVHRTDLSRFSDFAQHYLRWYEHEYPSSYTRTKQIVEQHLLPHFKDHYLDQLAPRLVETWKVDRLEKVKAATVSKELRCFKAMLNRALDWEIIKRHPFARVKAPRQLDDKPISFYSIDEMEAIYRIDPNNRFIWQLMANTGIRRSEALNAKREHVRKGRIRIVSTEDARTKSGKWREVPLSPAANEAILRLGHEYLLPRVYPQSLSRAFKRAAMRADLDGSIHWLRHTFCSHLVMSGVPIKTVQELAGHASINTTMKYAHLAPDYLSNIMDRFHV